MSRGGYLNIETTGNFDEDAGELTLYVVVVDGWEEVNCFYADDDFAEFQAHVTAGDAGERCEVRRLTFQLTQTEVTYTAEPHTSD